MKCHHIVDEKTVNFLRPKLPHRSPLFYGLPKIFKTHIPLRPIVSGCGGPTHNLPKFITYFIQPLADSLPSYFKDATHFLNMLQSQRIASRSCIFVTADVTSLYTNIPHRKGIDAVKYYMKQIPLSARMQHCQSIAFTDIILETILTHSTFKFSNEFYHQKRGHRWAHGWRHLTPTCLWDG